MAFHDPHTPARGDFTRDHLPGFPEIPARQQPFAADPACPDCGGDGLDDEAGPCQRCVAESRS